jgi:LysR family transcriptional regulator, nod-box dependent transcriptional activator
MRLHRLDLNLLIVLDILLAEQSVSQTAQRLSMTQPAISNALSRLRLHFDDDLFVVMGRRMVPTPLCESLAEPVRRIIAELSIIAAARPTFDPATADRTITIICSDYVFLVFLSEALCKLAVLAPSLKVRVLQTQESMAELLRSGRADFGIFPEQRLVDGLPHVAIFDDSFLARSYRPSSTLRSSMSAPASVPPRHRISSRSPWRSTTSCATSPSMRQTLQGWPRWWREPSI